MLICTSFLPPSVRSLPPRSLALSPFHSFASDLGLDDQLLNETIVFSSLAKQLVIGDHLKSQAFLASIQKQKEEGPEKTKVSSSSASSSKPDKLGPNNTRETKEISLILSNLALYSFPPPVLIDGRKFMIYNDYKRIPLSVGFLVFILIRFSFLV
jgi:hypothetical protein